MSEIIDFYFSTLTSFFNLMIQFEFFRILYFSLIFFIIILFIMKIVNND